MNIASTKPHFFSRQPLSALAKTVITTLLILTVFLAILLLVSKQIAVLVAAVIIFLLAGFVATGIRWAPLIPGLLSIPVLYGLATASSYPLYHLGRPKDALPIPWLSFVMFVVILVLFWSLSLTAVSGIATVIDNYTRRESKTPRWYTPALAAALGLLVGGIIVGALAQPGAGSAAATTSTTTTSGVPTVHLSAFNFAQSTVTVPKGSKLTIVDDGTFHHNLSTGTWVNGQPQPENQAGEPAVKNLDFDQAGKSVQIGPFTTAGTYHLYCSIHEGMTLTIVVQ